MSRNSKIGAAVIAVLVLLFIMAPSSSTSDGSFAHRYKLVFNSVPGLAVGSMVKMAGVDIGKVDDIDFCTQEDRLKFGPDANVVVSISTDYDTKIPEDSSSGVISLSAGSLWLEIAPGISDKYIDGKSIVRLNTLPSSSTDLSALNINTFKRLKAQFADLSKVARDPKTKTMLFDMASNARFYTNEMRLASKGAGDYTKSIANKIRSGEQAVTMQLDRLDKQLLQASDSLNKYSSGLKNKTAGWDQKAKEMNSSIDAMSRLALDESARYKTLSAAVEQKMIKVCDPAVLKRLHKASEKLESYAQIGEDLQMIADDPGTQQSIKDMVHNYREQSQSIRSLIEKIEGKVSGKNKEEDSASSAGKDSGNQPDAAQTAGSPSEANTESADEQLPSAGGNAPSPTPAASGN